MDKRIIKAIEWLLLEFEARMITLMIWVCWICGITSDDVERVRDEQNVDSGPATMINNPQRSPDPPQRS